MLHIVKPLWTSKDCCDSWYSTDTFMYKEHSYKKIQNFGLPGFCYMSSVCIENDDLHHVILIIHSKTCIYSIHIFYFKELWRSIEVNAESNCNAPTKGGVSWWNWNSTNEIVQISQSMVNVCRFGGKLWHIQGNTLLSMIMLCIVLLGYPSFLMYTVFSSKLLHKFAWMDKCQLRLQVT
jgi:hypothetical protein